MNTAKRAYNPKAVRKIKRRKKKDSREIDISGDKGTSGKSRDDDKNNNNNNTNNNERNRAKVKRVIDRPFLFYPFALL